MRLAGRRALLTGAAGGLGRAIAARFAAEGADLCLVDLIDTAAVGESVRAAGRRAIVEQADVSDSSAVQSIVTRVANDWGGIDILVNLAGVGSHGSSDDVTEAEWQRVLRCNLTSVFVCCQAVLPGMRSRGYGRIVNIGSLLAKNGGNPRPWLDESEQKRAGNLAYGASKAGVHALTLYLAKENAHRGITVNAVAPGPIGSNPRLLNVFPEALKSQIPVGRLGRADEVADAVAFLAGEQAGFITGEILDVNGGSWCD
jgi:3-oxoacyl-[acyl-carrier protein] reductase